jgi:hypothetical protein
MGCKASNLKIWNDPYLFQMTLSLAVVEAIEKIYFQNDKILYFIDLDVRLCENNFRINRS